MHGEECSCGTAVRAGLAHHQVATRTVLMRTHTSNALTSLCGELLPRIPVTAQAIWGVWAVKVTPKQTSILLSIASMQLPGSTNVGQCNYTHMRGGVVPSGG